VPLHVLLKQVNLDHTGDPQRPPEGVSPQREREAGRIVMQ
jgi:hypothetical protein